MENTKKYFAYLYRTEATPAYAPDVDLCVCLDLVDLYDEIFKTMGLLPKLEFVGILSNDGIDHTDDFLKTIEKMKEVFKIYAIMDKDPSAGYNWSDNPAKKMYEELEEWKEDQRLYGVYKAKQERWL